MSFVSANSVVFPIWAHTHPSPVVNFKYCPKAPLFHLLQCYVGFHVVNHMNQPYHHGLPWLLRSQNCSHPRSPRVWASQLQGAARAWRTKEAFERSRVSGGVCCVPLIRHIMLLASYEKYFYIFLYHDSYINYIIGIVSWSLLKHEI